LSADTFVWVGSCRGLEVLVLWSAINQSAASLDAVADLPELRMLNLHNCRKLQKEDFARSFSEGRLKKLSKFYLWGYGPESMEVRKMFPWVAKEGECTVPDVFTMWQECFHTTLGAGD